MNRLHCIANQSKSYKDLELVFSLHNIAKKGLKIHGINNTNYTR